MNAKVIYVAGVPAAGKTTIMKRVREALFAGAEQFGQGACKGIRCGDLYMIGVFDGSTFEGTDRLSMTAIDDVLAFIEGLQGGTVLVEGDRLFNERFLRTTRATVVLIDADKAIIKQRHSTRDQQSETFLKGRRTKIENFKKRHPKVRTFWNNTLTDSQRIAKMIIQATK